MKYIVMQVTHPSGLTQEMPFVFPQTLIHDDMRLAVSDMLDSYQMTYKCISAGECNLVASEPGCSGRSDSIGVESRGDKDDDLIKFYNYMAGIS